MHHDLFDDLFGFKAVKGFMGMIPASVTETWGGILATIWITGGFDKLSDFFGEGVSNDLFAVLFAKFFDEIISPQINRISVQDYFPNVYALFQQPVVGDAAVIREQGDIPEFKLALQRDLDSLVVRLRSLGQGTLSQQMDKLISSGSLLKATIPNFNFTKFNKALTETFISEKIIIRDL